MILLARGLVWLVSFLLLVLLSVAGLVLAVFCIGTGTSGPSLGRLASLLQLDSLRDTVATWLAQLEADGSIATVAGLCGLGAMLLGVVLLVGLLAPRRERLVKLPGETNGTVAARRRPLGQAAGTLVEQTRGVTGAKARVRPGRRGGGRVNVRASRPRSADANQVRGGALEQLRDLTEPFGLKARVRLDGRGERVQ
jgi:hypothetical protein